MSNRTVVRRREFLRLSALATGAVAVASCTQPSPAAPSAPASPQVTKPPAEPTKPAAPAAAPTKAPEPTKPAAVATVAPTTPPAAATAVPKTAERPGKQLIGKLEGPEVVTDPAKFPKKLNEAPMLAELVKSGKLPPVEKRLPEEPLVIKPVREIGKHGGTWRRGFTGPGDFYNGNRTAGHDHILFFDYLATRAMPNIAKGWEVSDSGRVTTVYLRRGMRWSDGQPFTADDFVFWYDDLYLNKELNPAPTVAFTINGKPGVLEKVDTYTVRYRFPDPYYLFPEILAGFAPIASHSNYGRVANGGFAPAHYLKQFHPKYTAKEELDKQVKDGKLDNWTSLLKFKNSWALNPELPVVTAWKTTSPANTSSWVLERNPYSIWVDTEGNQLPYVDKIVMGLAENLEVINLRAIAGEYDFQERHTDIQKLPVFLENQAKGGYKVHLDIGDYGSDVSYRFNISYEADPEIGKWFSVTDFRRALSLGIDRDQINEVFFLGIGTPASVVPVDANPYSPGPEYRTLWATYDPKKANEMLDKIGLDKKDGEGYRLRSDGKGRLRIELTAMGAQFVQYPQLGEMIKAQWKKIGIDLSVLEQERSLVLTRDAANETQLLGWTNDGTERMFTSPDHLLPLRADCNGQGALFGKWFSSGGTAGKEPPPRMREAMEKWRKAFSVPDEERIKLGKEIWKIIAEEVWQMGTVGQSGAIMGVRVAKVNMGNVPQRHVLSLDGMTPGLSRPQTFFWKS